MNLNLTKTAQGFLIPATQDDAELLEKVKPGQTISAEFKRKRNYKFHKKYFALLNFAFDHFEPNLTHKGQPIEKNKERFRKDVTILAGHYEIVPNLAGCLRLEAKSISFGNMSEDDFAEFYNSVVNVILQKVLVNYKREDLDRVIDQVIGFG